jgi:hypothetical protein
VFSNVSKDKGMPSAAVYKQFVTSQKTRIFNYIAVKVSKLDFCKIMLEKMRECHVKFGEVEFIFLILEAF